MSCHPRDYRPGDVFLIAIQSPYANHAAVLLEDGRVFHHLIGQRSGPAVYGGALRNNTLGVYRHKEIPDTTVEREKVDFMTLLPPEIRKKFEAAQAARAAAAEQDHPEPLGPGE